MKTQVAIACLMAATQALSISAAMPGNLPALSTNTTDEQCCCAPVMPCMPTCATPCKEEPKEEPKKEEYVPEDVARIVEIIEEKEEKEAVPDVAPVVIEAVPDVAPVVVKAEPKKKEVEVYKTKVEEIPKGASALEKILLEADGRVVIIDF